MHRFMHETTLPEGAFFHLFVKGDKEAVDHTMTPAGEFSVYRINHATFGACIGITDVRDYGVVFSDKKIPAHYPHKRRADAPAKAA